MERKRSIDKVDSRKMIYVDMVEIREKTRQEDRRQNREQRKNI
jgi:hypothetical protein